MGKRKLIDTNNSDIENKKSGKMKKVATIALNIHVEHCKSW